MKKYSQKAKPVKYLLIAIVMLCVILISMYKSFADVNYELDYQDPAGDVLEYNQTWHLKGTVDIYPYIDLKWLKSNSDADGNVVLRLEVKNNQIIEKSNLTSYVFRIFTTANNSTGYNVTYKNGTTTITDFDNTIEDDLTAETSIINDNGEVLLVNISKTYYLSNAVHFNIDAFTWKETGNHTYIDYISAVPGHPGATSDVVDGVPDTGLPIPWWLLLIIVLVIIVGIVVIVIVLRNSGRI